MPDLCVINCRPEPEPEPVIIHEVHAELKPAKVEEATDAGPQRPIEHSPEEGI